MGWRAVIVIGFITSLMAIGFASVGMFAQSNKDIGLPPQFSYGMIGLAGVCVLSAVACFVPASRWWVLPVLAFIFGTTIFLAKTASIGKL